MPSITMKLCALLGIMAAIGITYRHLTQTRLLAQTTPKIDSNAAPVTTNTTETQQTLLKKLTPLTNYADGLYTGRFIHAIRARNTSDENLQEPAIKQKVWQVRLYIQGDKRLYYLQDANKELVYKVLYYATTATATSRALRILAWDPKRDILFAPQRTALHQRILQTGFNFIDLSLQPYAIRYAYRHSPPPATALSQTTAATAANNKISHITTEQKILKELPQELIPTVPARFLPHEYQPQLTDKYSIVRLYIQNNANVSNVDLFRIDFYMRPLLLRKTIYTVAQHKIYNIARRQKENIAATTQFKALDFQRNTISILELNNYDTRKKIKVALFDPRFIRYQ